MIGGEAPSSVALIGVPEAAHCLGFSLVSVCRVNYNLRFAIRKQFLPLPAKDIHHDAAKQALVNDSWAMTNDPLHLRHGGFDFYMDFGAENLLGTVKDNQKMAGLNEGITKIKQLLQRFANIPDAIGGVELETIFDEDQHRYQVIVQGCQDKKRVHGSLVHIDFSQG